MQLPHHSVASWSCFWSSALNQWLPPRKKTHENEKMKELVLTWARDITNDAAASVALLRFLMWIALINTHWTVWLFRADGFPLCFSSPWTPETAQRPNPSCQGFQSERRGNPCTGNIYHDHRQQVTTTSEGGSKLLPGDFSLFTVNIYSSGVQCCWHYVLFTGNNKPKKGKREKQKLSFNFLIFLCLTCLEKG